MSKSNSKDIYYLVSEKDTDNPQSLVVVRNGSASVIAGKDLRTFKKSKPDTIKHPSKVFELLTNDPSHPIIGRWIDELGASDSLKHSKAREKRTKNLPAEVKKKIKEMKDKGVNYSRIAELFGVSRGYISGL